MFVDIENDDYVWNKPVNYLQVIDNELTRFFAKNKVHTNVFHDNCSFYHKVYKGNTLVFEAISLKVHNTFKEFQLRYQSLISNVQIIKTKRFHLKGGLFNFGRFLDIPVEAVFILNGEEYLIKVFDSY